MKENQSIILSQCYFHINKGHDSILLVDEWMVVQMMVVTESNKKSKKGYFLITFTGRVLNPLSKNNSETLYMISTSSKGMGEFLYLLCLLTI